MQQGIDAGSGDIGIAPEIPANIEPIARISPLGGPMANEMLQRVAARRGDIRVALRVSQRIEELALADDGARSPLLCGALTPDLDCLYQSPQHCSALPISREQSDALRARMVFGIDLSVSERGCSRQR
jgi:hypothetical protein